MMPSIAASLVGTGLSVALVVYALAALLLRPRTVKGDPALTQCRPVSVLKPLCGSEDGLETNLASLCEQDHPDFEIVCGVQDSKDGAIAVVERLRQRYPQVKLSLVIDDRVHGANRKVSNLINIERHVKRDVLVIADSDISVPSDYLRRVCAPLADEAVGLVTCLYRARALNPAWGRVGALFIDTWFTPSVRIASALGNSRFAFGATIAIRRATLHSAGGLTALRNRLADDYWLGELVRRTGASTVLSDVTVTTDVAEVSLGALWRREVRWLRTIRSLNRLGFSFLFVSFTTPMAILALSLSDTPWTLALCGCALALRVALCARVDGSVGVALLPLRDGLLALEWLAALVGRHVRWRDARLTVDPPPQASPLHSSATAPTVSGIREIP